MVNGLLRHHCFFVFSSCSLVRGRDIECVVDVLLLLYFSVDV